MRRARWPKILAALCLPPIFTAISLRLYLTDERVPGLVEGLLGSALRGGFHVGSFEWERFPVAFRTRDVRIRDPRGKPVLSVARLDLALASTRLLKGEIAVSRIALEGIEVHLEPSSTATGAAFGLVEAFSPKNPSPPAPPAKPGGFKPTVAVDALAVDGLTVELRRGALTVEARGIRIRENGFRYDLGGGLEGAIGVAAESIAIATAGGRYELGAVQLELPRVALDDGGAHVEGLFLRAAGSTLAVTGADLRGLAADPSFTAEGVLRVQLDTPLLRAILPAAADLHGTLRVALEGRGPLKSPTVQARLAGEGVSVAGTSLPVVEARVSWTPARLGLTALRVELEPAGGLTATATVALDGPHPRVDLALTLLALPLRALAARFVPDPSLLPASVAGTLALGQADLGARTGELRVALTAHGLPAKLRVPSLTVRAAATLEGSAIELAPLELSAGGGTVVVRGKLPLGTSGPFDVVLELRHPAPGPLLAALGVPVRADRIELDAAVSGRLPRAIQARGRLAVHHLAVPGVPAAELDVPFHLEKGRLGLDGAALLLAGGSVTLAGGVELLDPRGKPLAAPRLDLRAKAARLAVAALVKDQAQGTLEGELAISGPVPAFEASGELRVLSLVARGVAFDPAVVRASASGPRSIRLESLSLHPTRGGTIAASGALDLGARSVGLELQATGLPLALASDLLARPFPLEGHLDLEAHVEGALDDPHVRASLSASQLAYGSAPSADTGGDPLSIGGLTARVSGDTSRLQVGARWTGPSGSLDVEGQVAPELLDLHVKSASIALDRLPGLEAQQIGGSLAIDLSVTGAPRAPILSGRVGASGLTYGDDTIGDGRAIFRLGTSAGGWTVDADLFELVTGQARVRVTPELDVSVLARIRETSLAPYVADLRERDLDVTLAGTSTIHYGATGLSATVGLSRLELRAGERHLAATEPVRVNLRDGTARIRSLVLGGPLGRFKLSGSASSAKLDLHAGGDLDVALVAPLVAALSSASGHVSLTLALAGNAATPEVSGSIAIAGPVSIRPRSGLGELELRSGQVRLSSTSLSLDGLSGRMQGGVFSASGKVALLGLSPGAYQLAVHGQGLPFRTPDVIIEANADLDLSGEARDLSVSGRVDVVRGRYLRKIDLRNLGAFSSDSADGEPDDESAGANVSLDLQVVSAGTTEIRADAGLFALAMTLGCDLKVTGTARAPLIDGRISATEGTITFPKARLAVTDATIDFLSQVGSPIDPRIDLSAEGEVHTAGLSSDSSSEAYVTMTLSGTGRQVVLGLTSNPTLDRLEILSLLVTGLRSVVDTSATGRDADRLSAALSFAGSQLTGPLTELVSDQIEKAINLRIVLGAEVTNTGFRVTAGKDLTRRLHLEGAYARSFGEDQTVTSARARLTLLDALFFEGRTELVSGSGSSASALAEGQHSFLELRLRFFGE